jgi:hypothetical protein
MKLDIYPTRIECVDETGEKVFSVESFDASTASIDVPGLLTYAKWDQLAPLIRQALVDLRLVSEVDAT